MKKARLKKTIADAWTNLLQGIGVQGRDPRRSTHYVGEATLTQEQLTALYRSDGIARRIIDLPAGEMVRKWFTIPQDQDGRVVGYLLKELDAKNRILELITWAKLYGGAIAVLGVNDGGQLDEPLAEAGIRSVDFIKVYNRFEAIVNAGDYYTDPAQPSFGEPQFYTVTTPGGNTFRVHESRTLRLDGQLLPQAERTKNQGWGDSDLQHTYNSVRALGSVYDSAELIVNSFQEGVLEVNNLADLLSDDDGITALRNRLDTMALSKSVLNLLVLDSDGEKYSKQSSSVTGLDAILDRFVLRVSAATSIPVTLLMGQAPAGLNATGDSDIRNWYDKIASQQESWLRPVIERLVYLVMISKQGPTRGKEIQDWAVQFEPLWQLTEKETAELRKLVADTDQIYVNTGVLDPIEVAESRFGGETYSMETGLDR